MRFQEKKAVNIQIYVFYHFKFKQEFTQIILKKKINQKTAFTKEQNLKLVEDLPYTQ